MRIQNRIFLLEEIPRFQLTEYFQALNHNEQYCLNVICLRQLKSVNKTFNKIQFFSSIWKRNRVHCVNNARERLRTSVSFNKRPSFHERLMLIFKKKIIKKISDFLTLMDARTVMDVGKTLFKKRQFFTKFFSPDML